MPNGAPHSHPLSNRRKSEDEDGDIITVTEKCELDGAGNSVEIDIDDEGISVDLVLTCEYGDCGEVRHVTNLITV